MSNIAKDGDSISRKELARFVVEQFDSFVHVRTFPLINRKYKFTKSYHLSP